MADKLERTVQVALMTYTDASGFVGRTAFYGDKVLVHADDVERFDRLNGPGVPVEVGELVDDVSEGAPAGEGDADEAPPAPVRGRRGQG